MKGKSLSLVSLATFLCQAGRNEIHGLQLRGFETLQVMSTVCISFSLLNSAAAAPLRGNSNNSATTIARRHLMGDRTEAPTFMPTSSVEPSTSPSVSPSFEPTVKTNAPSTPAPSAAPSTESPTTAGPTELPSPSPSELPSLAPSTSAPTLFPTPSPSGAPTLSPAPTMSPTTSFPSTSPSSAPTGRFLVDLTNFQLILSGNLENADALTASTEEYLEMEMKRSIPELYDVELQLTSGRRLQSTATTFPVSYRGQAVFVTEPIPTESEVQSSQAAALANQQGLQAAIDGNPSIGDVFVQNIVLEDSGGGSDGGDTNIGLIAGVSAGGAVALALLGLVGFRYFKRPPPPPPSNPPPPRTSEYQGYETESERQQQELAHHDSVTVTTSNSTKQLQGGWVGTMDHKPEIDSESEYDEDVKVAQAAADSDISLADESMDAYSLAAESDNEVDDVEKAELLEKLALYQGRQSRSPEINRATRYARKPSLERSPGEESTFSYDQVGGTPLLGDAGSDDEEGILEPSLFQTVSDVHSPDASSKIQAAQFRVPEARADSQSDVPFDERSSGPDFVTEDLESISKRRDEARELSRKINFGSQDAEDEPNTLVPKPTPQDMPTESEEQQGLSSYLRERKRAA